MLNYLNIYTQYLHINIDTLHLHIYTQYLHIYTQYISIYTNIYISTFRRATFPENVDIREIACHLAAKVFIQAIEENLVVSRLNCYSIPPSID